MQLYYSCTLFKTLDLTVEGKIYIIHLAKSVFDRILEFQRLMRCKCRTTFRLGNDFSFKSITSVCFPCISHCIGYNWHALMLTSQNRLGVQRVKAATLSIVAGVHEARQRPLVWRASCAPIVARKCWPQGDRFYRSLTVWPILSHLGRSGGEGEETAEGAGEGPKGTVPHPGEAQAGYRLQEPRQRTR